MTIKYRILKKNAKAPEYSHIGDAGADLYATSKRLVESEEGENYIEYGTGIAIEIPRGFVGLLFPRSSISKRQLILANSVGVIDSGYRGEIKLRFKFTGIYDKVATAKLLANNPDGIDLDAIKVLRQGPLGAFEQRIYNVGDKVGQLVIIAAPSHTFKQVDTLSSSEREDGGFGSTDTPQSL